MKYEGDRVVVEAPRGLEYMLLQAIFSSAKTVAKSKISQGVFSPRPNKNDANTFTKFSQETGSPISSNKSFLDFAFQVLDWAEKESLSSTNKFLSSYSSIQVKPSKLSLGGDKYAAVQLFKVEKYEYGRDYMESYGAVKMQIRHDIYWLALLMAGFALTYSGFADNEMVFTTLPEDFITLTYSSLACKDYMHLFSNISNIVYSGERGISGLVARIRRLDPLIAFVQLLSYMLAREWSSEVPLNEVSRFPINLYRVRIGNTFTLIERSLGDLAPFIQFAYQLLSREPEGTRLLEKIEELCRCTLTTRAGSTRRCEMSYSEYYTLTMKLYQAISGSYNAYSLAYELGRILTRANGLRVFRESELKVLIDVLVA
ncbi:MAG: hypothetical protein DRJ69_01390 [Thermoprotei archaeon]|nr:MAG: hypothetical protein DRJ69_01390 [Thermoprotei archaeon]